METARRYSRSLREAFPQDWMESALGIEKPIRCCSPWYVRLWRQLKEVFK